MSTIKIHRDGGPLHDFLRRCTEAVKNPRTLAAFNAELAKVGQCCILEPEGTVTISDPEWEAARRQGRASVDAEGDETMHDKPVTRPAVLQ